MTKEHGRSGSPYGPSPAATDAAIRSAAPGPEAVGALRGLDAAHDPALGLDGSICKRDVIELLRDMYGGRARTLPGPAARLMRHWEEQAGAR